jgi:signal transduction histidine kinase
MTRAQLVRTALVTGIILVIVLALDFLVNVVIAPGHAPYTPIITAVIALLVTPAAVAYLIVQNSKIHRAQSALADERVARVAADGANAAKSQFLASMSHELRTPLNAIIGYAELIEEAPEARTTEADAARIRAAAHHLLTMINMVLDHVKLETGDLRLESGQTQLAPVFAAVVDAVRPLAEQNGNTIEATCARSIGSAWIDEQRLMQCMLNVANNAAKFTKNGHVVLKLDGDNDSFTLEVSDTGVGIANGNVERIFEPFTQADGSFTRERDGAGLGLAVTKQLLEVMGGTIAVVSAPGRGSTFTLTLPRTTARSNVVPFAA